MTPQVRAMRKNAPEEGVNFEIYGVFVTICRHVRCDALTKYPR